MKVKRENINLKMIGSLMFRLLPVQILLAAVGSVNGLVSGFFAANYVGNEAMNAVGLYGPVSFLLGAISTLLAGGCAIVCGQYLGQSRQDRLQGVFALDVVVSAGTAILLTIVLACMSVFDLSGILAADPTVRPAFNRYLLGQTIGIVPLMLGNQLSVFLAIENRSRRTFAASLVYIAVNLVLDLVFVKQMKMESFGLAMASSLGLWMFMLVQAQYFLSGKAVLKPAFRHPAWNECTRVLMVGFPGAASLLYQTIRGIIVNRLLAVCTGSIGVSAFTAANSLLALFWAVPSGMFAVSRLLISVSAGEEDRSTLGDILRVMMRRFLPLLLAMDIMLALCAVPLTHLFYHDPSSAVFRMTVSCLRILPLCMPLSTVLMHFVCFGQIFSRQGYVNVLALLDGVVCVAGFSFLLIGTMGIEGVCTANVLNGAVTTAFIVGYAWVKQKRFPRTMEELAVIPEDFGVPEEDRIDVSVRTIEEVVEVSERIQSFCLSKGIDEKRAYYAGLSMEEMAGNVVEHGFTKDRKKHSVDLRASYKNGRIVLRIKDDCIPFDPKERMEITGGEDGMKNIGIRMIYRMMNDIQYRNILGLNVLTITV